MGRFVSREALAAVLLSSTVLVCAEVARADAPTTEQELLACGTPEMQIRRTEHFVIAYDTSEETLNDVVSRLEATYRAVERFCSVYDIETISLEGRLFVLLFDRYENYGTYGQDVGFEWQGSAGFYSQRDNTSAFYNIQNAPELAEINRYVAKLEEEVKGLRKGRRTDRGLIRKKTRQRAKLLARRDRIVERINRTTIQHETAHQLLFNAGLHVRGGQNPGWLVEGMACLFETPPTRHGAGFAAINQMRLGDFRECCGGGDTGKRLDGRDFQTALAGGQFLPLRDLIGDPDLFFKRGDSNLVHYYSQAWALVCYLHRTQREEFGAYLWSLSEREPGVRLSGEEELAEFERIFGPLDESFERRWADYILTDLRFKRSALK